MNKKVDASSKVRKKLSSSRGAQSASKLRAVTSRLPDVPPLNAREVAELCGVELKTVHNWVGEGLIPHFRTPGRHLRFQPADVEQFLQHCGYQQPSVDTRTVLVVAQGRLKGRLKRHLQGTHCHYYQDPLASLIGAGKHQPDALVIERAALNGSPVGQYLSALRRALPDSQLILLQDDGERVATRDPNLSIVSPNKLRELRGRLGLPA